MSGPIEFLARAAPMARDGDRADALFVLAGGQERKTFAAERWRGGAAGALVLSVGRFEWRRYGRLGLPGDEALRDAVERVPHRRRHFFVVLRRSGAEAVADVVRVDKRPFGTRHELRALRGLAAERGWGSLVLVSSAFHLRRVSLMARRIFRGTGVSLAYLGVPGATDRYGPATWRRTFRGVRVIASEFVKLALYAALLRG